MTNEELKAAIAQWDTKHTTYLRAIKSFIESARELSQLKDCTHPDMVMVPRKPTTEMLKAMADCDDDAPWIDSWEAALEAAQKGKQNEN